MPTTAPSLLTGDSLSLYRIVNVYYAELDSGAEIPEPGGPLDEFWLHAGWLSPEGISENDNSENQEFTPYQSAGPQLVVNTERNVTFGATLWSTSSFVANRLYYSKKPDAFTYDEASKTVRLRDGGLRDRDIIMLCLEFIGLNGGRKRVFIENGEATERGAPTGDKQNVTGYPLTWRPYETGDGQEPIIREWTLTDRELPMWADVTGTPDP
ncbi:hypothetical protein [Hoyosella altamirensis]|uniref:Major tail protein n=1 Tax=Hoyosella altamirensis TaxID=616997 RepID=A0A839RV86_9ACTN|nr:hypothetical protein [Hoyosella altamirensis]MBB3040148.1 hypothetical protein [Hoyosella altamirensis]